MYDQCAKNAGVRLIVKTYEKLDQLTSLRFIAAAMVVLCHMAGVFGFSAGHLLDSLTTGVSFFFVLSGFILAHVYPELKGRGEVSGFLRARFARIWPGHVATFLLAIWLLRLPLDGRTALSNLLLVQAWNPLSTSASYFSYNSPSWSLSTELFFYLAFPYLILNWKRKWPIRVLLSGGILVVIICYVNYLKLADGGPSYLYVNPASRIFEFMFGMLMQLAWQRCRGRLNWNFALATALEVAVIACCSFSIYVVPDVANSLSFAWTGAGFSAWLYQSGNMFAFGAVIFVMAFGRGGVSRLLVRPWFVVLGEISFSIYLLHQIFLRFYLEYIVFFPKIPDGIAFILFWMFLLVSSYVMWSWLEMPARRAIIQWHPWRWLVKHWQPRRWFIKRRQQRVEHQRANEVADSVRVRRTMREFLAENRSPIAAGLILGLFVVVVRYEFESIRTSVPAIGSADSKARTSAMIGRLMGSIRAEDVDAVRWALDSGVDPNGQDSKGYLPLVVASWLGEREIVEVLLGRGANPKLQSRDGISPLIAAAIQGRPSIVRILVNAGASSNAQGSDGSTPLIAAASKGDRAVVDVLLAIGANPNMARNDGYTALMEASMFGDATMVRALADKGAAVDGQAMDGTTPLMIAASKGNLAVVTALLDLGATPGEAKVGGYTALIGAAMNGDPDIVRALVGKGANVDGNVKGSNTPLMVAAWKGDREVVDLLLSFGASTDLPNAEGLTALMMASMAGHGEIVEALARRGANVNVANAKGSTPLMLAAYAGKRGLVDLLLTMGASVEATNKDGRTAQDLARMGKHRDIIVLLTSKASISRDRNPTVH